MKNDSSVALRRTPRTEEEIVDRRREAPLIGIVDDDEAVRDSISSLVRSVGLRAMAFPSAESFLGSNWMHDSDCLILDVRMPGLSGLELQSRLAVMGLPIPVIFATAHYDDDDRARALDRGAVAFLRKPFTDEALIEAMCSALA
jgi:FixJ family two-component response regulator